MKPTRPTEDQSTAVADPLEFDFSTPAYRDFSHCLEAQLTELEALWQHLAAPAALRVGRTHKRRDLTC